MIVYEDIVSGDQVLSDSYAQKPLQIPVQGVATAIPNVFAVQSRMVTKGPLEVNTGSNASKEETEEGVDDAAARVCDLKDPELGFGYEGPQSYSMGEFEVLFKGWCKAVKEKIEASGQKPMEFMQAARAMYPAIKENYSNMEVYHPKSYSSETFILGFWDDEANEVGAPKFIFFTPALKRIKY
ncbi:hypothetical protein BASA81_003176 [Batrachochytrium salamandrivorans]|nr:hypothetical protein BASA81_003176 [Batrachochytrium salamandrivorans]